MYVIDSYSVGSRLNVKLGCILPPLTALLRVSDDIRLIMDNRQGAISSLFDFSKKFDSLNHSLWLAKLRAIGFSNEVLTWLGSFLADRRC